MGKDYQNQLENISKDWVSSNYEKVTDTNSPTAHIDELLCEKNLEPGGMVNLSLKMFCFITDEVKKLKIPVRPKLLIELKGISDKLELNIPANKDEIIEQLDDYTPPAFYLATWERQKKFIEIEEYKKYLPFDLIVSNDIFSYYF